MINREDKNKYVGGMEPEEFVLDESDQEIIEELRKERKTKIIIISSVVIFLLIIFIAYKAVPQLGKGLKKSEELVVTYMEGLDEADSEKVQSVMDPETVNSESADTLVSIFKTYESSGITYTVDYTIGEGREADGDELEAMCSAIYDSTASKADVEKGYVIPVDGAIILSYDGQKSTYDLDMDIICYEKDGEWYLGGTLANEADTTDTTEAAS